MATPQLYSKRITLFVPEHTFDGLLKRLIAVRQRQSGYVPRAPELLREALIRGLTELISDLEKFPIPPPTT